MHTSNVIKTCLILSFLFTSLSLQAQDPEPEGESSGVLEEVMVTASRRGEEDIMTTPNAITALTGEEVLTYALRDLNDIAVDVPGLSGGSVSAFKSAQFAMRGVSETTIILYKESPVGVFLDDFVVPHIQTSNLEMFDIETIEVLRGPQGTLFGKNTTGGVISVRTKRPILEENSAEGQLQYGSFDTWIGRAALNFAAGDTVSFRFAGTYRNSAGYYKNNATYGPIGSPLPFNSTYAGTSGAGDGSSLGGDDVFSGRAKMLWAPNDDVNILFQYEIVRDNGDTPPVVQESEEGYLVPLWGWNVPTGDPIKNAGISNRVEDTLNLAGGHQVDIDGYYINGDWAVNSDYTVYFNGGIRKQESRLPSSYVGATGPVSLFDATRDDDRKTSQLEARVGSTLGGPFNFTTGAFFQKDEVEFCVMQYVGFLDGFFLGTPPDWFNDNPRLLCNTQDAKAWALYFDGTYEVTDRFQITAGLRYTDESKDWAGRPMTFTLDGQPILDVINEPIEGADFTRFPQGVVYDSHSWTEPTYRLVFGYDFTENDYGYAKYSRGFKSGGYNDQLGTQLDPITELAAQPTEPEIADSWEIGYKTTSTDGSANFAIDAYYVIYTDAQRTFNVSFPGGGQETLFFNAAKLKVWGIEAEGAWAVSDSFLVRYNGSYMHAEYSEFQADTDYDGIIDVDLSDKPVTRAPKWMGTVSGQYTTRVSDGFDLEISGRVAYESSSYAGYSDVATRFDPKLNARTLVDATITLRDVQNRYYVSLLGSNLLDERYRVGSLSVANLWIMSAYGPPRYFGVEFGTNFDW